MVKSQESKTNETKEATSSSTRVLRERKRKRQITTPPSPPPPPRPRPRPPPRKTPSSMGAISLYRGNLHRVPQDVPRRWPMPKQGISLNDFRHLIDRRNKSLSLLPSTSDASPLTHAKPPITAPPPPPPAEKIEKVTANPNLCAEGGGNDDVVMVDVRVEDGGDSRPLDQTLAVVVKEKEIVTRVDVDSQIPDSQGKDKSDVSDAKQRRIREVEERLKFLTEEKHDLVKRLKKVLTAEEELRRLGSVQANRPPPPLQVDASNDSGSMTRHATPRTGSDANVNVDMEMEGDDALNHKSRQLLRMSSTSPSAESALRRPPHFQHNPASYPSRAAMVAAGSPSRFAPTGTHGPSSNLPTVSVTGTNYAASSPSPAASGGTSVFRDARQPSPWK